MSIRLVIVEDDPLLLENLKMLLGGEAGIMIAGAFRNAEEAMASLERLAPDLLLVDLGLPGMPGVELIRRYKASQPSVDVMAHTVFEDRENVFSAIKAGASGYLLKGSSPREIIEAIHELRRGGAPMSPKIARKLIQEFQTDTAGNQYLLSLREQEIVRCIEEGLTYKQISQRLKISAHTVHTHIKRIYEKLHAKNRAEALTKARKSGVI